MNLIAKPVFSTLCILCLAGVRAAPKRSHSGKLRHHRVWIYARARMAAWGVGRDKAALSSGCKSHPANRSSRKQPEQLWRKRNG